MGHGLAEPVAVVHGQGVPPERLVLLVDGIALARRARRCAVGEVNPIDRERDRRRFDNGRAVHDNGEPQPRLAAEQSDFHVPQRAGGRKRITPLRLDGGGHQGAHQETHGQSRHDRPSVDLDPIIVVLGDRDVLRPMGVRSAPSGDNTGRTPIGRIGFATHTNQD